MYSTARMNGSIWLTMVLSTLCMFGGHREQAMALVACDHRAADPCECQKYNRGGTTGVHFFICCNNLGDGDATGAAVCDGETYQGASTGPYCGTGGTTVAGVHNGQVFGKACASGASFCCGGCNGQAKAKAACITKGIVPGFCWKNTICFKKYCDKKFAGECDCDNATSTTSGTTTISTTSTSLSEPFTWCGDEVCDADEDVNNCAIDCCPTVNPDCVSTSVTTAPSGSEEPTCTPECCGESTCCGSSIAPSLFPSWTPTPPPSMNAPTISQTPSPASAPSPQPSTIEPTPAPTPSSSTLEPTPTPTPSPASPPTPSQSTIEPTPAQTPTPSGVSTSTGDPSTALPATTLIPLATTTIPPATTTTPVPTTTTAVPTTTTAVPTTTTAVPTTTTAAPTTTTAAPTTTTAVPTTTTAVPTTTTAVPTTTTAVPTTTTAVPTTTTAVPTTTTTVPATTNPAPTPSQSSIEPTPTPTPTPASMFTSTDDPSTATTTGSPVTGTPNGSISCSHECWTDCDCPDNACKQSGDIGISSGNLDPSELASAGIAIDVLLQAPRLTPGLPALVQEALDGLFAILLQNRPKIFIKVEWVECYHSACYVFWDEEECIVKTSDWVEIDIPASMPVYQGLGYWPPMGDWSDYADEIQAAIDAAVAAACVGKGCQEPTPEPTAGVSTSTDDPSTAVPTTTTAAPTTTTAAPTTTTAAPTTTTAAPTTTTAAPTTTTTAPTTTTAAPATTPAAPTTTTAAPTTTTVAPTTTTAAPATTTAAPITTTVALTTTTAAPIITTVVPTTTTAVPTTTTQAPTPSQSTVEPTPAPTPTPASMSTSTDDPSTATTTGTPVTGTANGSISCSHECWTDCDCPDNACKQSGDIGISTTGMDPKELAQTGIAIDVLLKAPRLTPGLPALVQEALSGLFTILIQNRPRIFIKVEWVECYHSACYVFWDEEECIVKTSEWVEIDIPDSLLGYQAAGFWPAISDWSNFATEIQTAIDDAVAATCVGKGCQE